MSPVVLSGRVTGPEGQPIAGANVMFTWGPVDLRDIAQTTGPDGTFALTAPAEGRYRIAVHAAGHTAAQREVKIEAASIVTLEIVLGRER